MNRVCYRASLAALTLLFVWFTWRGILFFFSGDDMMNMYFAWSINPWRIARAQFMIWLPVYRPLGAAVYRIFYAAFGFHPLPLYIFSWLLLALNAALSVRFFRAFRLTAAGVIVAAAFALVHGNFQDLYISSGTIYDRFWFLFTVLGILVYARSDVRRRPAFFRLILLCLFCMNSKESGVALPALLACYEAVFVLPGLVRSGEWKQRLKNIAPLYVLLGAMSLLFIFGRVKHTPELVLTAAYRPHADLGLWFTRLAEYWGALSYQTVPFTAMSAGVLLFALIGVALLLRDRAMIFGWLFFVITITPVALISLRPGYVLYVPELGLALYAGAACSRLKLRREVGPAETPVAPYPQWLLAGAFIVAVTVFHVRHWPGPVDPHNPEYQLSTQMKAMYPTLPPATKFLFVNDNFLPASWDVTFTLRLLYGDRTIVAHRLIAPADQQPDPTQPIQYDHVFEQDSGIYRELDNRDYKESIRLHLFRDYAVGRELNFTRKDSIAYVVSGVFEGDISNRTRWTMPQAKLKFDIFPARARFTAQIWVPDFVSKGGQRTLSVLVNGNKVGDFPLTHEGENLLAFPVQPQMITADGLTIVEMNVSNPYRDAQGVQYGVLLMRAGFVSDSGR